VSAQTPTAFTRDASITSWGFGAEETNPMAASRVAAFQTAYPTIKLELVPQFDDQKLLTGFASNQLPDLLWMDRSKIASWAARGVLAPLNDMAANAGIDPSKYYPSALDEVTYDGKIYGIPQFMDVRGLYANLDLLQAANISGSDLDTSNWDQLSQMGAQLIKKNGDQVDVWGFDHKLESGFIWLWGTGNGGTFLNDDASKTSYDDEKVVDALTWGVKAYDDQGGYKLLESAATTWQGDEQFARGQVVMTMYENWMLGIVARVAPDLNFQVSPIQPNGKPGTSVSYAGGSAWCIPNGAKDPEAAWQFIQFMDSTDTWRIGAQGVKTYQESQGKPYIPSLTANPTADQLQIDEFYTTLGNQFDTAVQLWPQILQQSFIRPISKSPVGAQLDDAMQQQGVLPALRKESDPSDALSNANSEAQAAIDSM